MNALKQDLQAAKSQLCVCLFFLKQSLGIKEPLFSKMNGNRVFGAVTSYFLKCFVPGLRISLEIMTLQPRCEDVETAEGVAITVTGVAQVKAQYGGFKVASDLSRIRMQYHNFASCSVFILYNVH